MVLVFSYRRLYKEDMARVDIYGKHIDCVGKAMNLSGGDIVPAKAKAGTNLDPVLDTIRIGLIQLLSGFGFVLHAVVIFVLAKSLPQGFRWPKKSKHRKLLVVFVIMFSLGICHICICHNTHCHSQEV